MYCDLFIKKITKNKFKSFNEIKEKALEYGINISEIDKKPVIFIDSEENHIEKYIQFLKVINSDYIFNEKNICNLKKNIDRFEKNFIFDFIHTFIEKYNIEYIYSHRKSAVDNIKLLFNKQACLFPLTKEEYEVFKHYLK